MKRHTARTLMSLLLLVWSAGATYGEVKMVRMKIAGYLCGN
ncbi:MAG TPA: hypothetical protein VF762_07845 [Blastocatellia bacterium]|jgi:hypothetical protein